jgi:hypothetical protein
MRRIATLVLAAGLIAACGSSNRSTTPPTPPATSAPAGTTAVPPKLDFVLDDAGLHEPAGPVDAGMFRVSFVDRRTNPPAGQSVTLRTRPSGPIIVIDEIPAGTTKTVTLLANVIFEIAIDGVTRTDIPQNGSLDIHTSPQYPTPAT